MKKKRVYIDFAPVLACNSLFNLILSLRSDGKTTAIKRLIWGVFNDTGEVGVYCRRFKTEMTYELMFDWWLDLFNYWKATGYEKPEWNYKADKSGAYIQRAEGEPWEMVARFIPLSAAQKAKSSLTKGKYKNIYVDEYIPLDGRYLKNEVTYILDLYKTIDRETETNIIIVCGNKITAYNPICKYFNIVTLLDGLHTYMGGELSILSYFNNGNVEQNKQSRFGELVKGTAYEDFNNGLTLFDDNSIIIDEHHSNIVRYVFTVYDNYYALYHSGHGNSYCIDTFDKNKLMGRKPIAFECAPKGVKAIPWEEAKEVKEVIKDLRFNRKIAYSNMQVCDEFNYYFKKL